MTNDPDNWTEIEEPSEEDFARAEEEDRQLESGRAGRFRILRLVGILVVVVALVLYLSLPYSYVITIGRFRLRVPTIRTRPIPLAPHKSSPKQPA